jgi:hypothetical protein
MLKKGLYALLLYESNLVRERINLYSEIQIEYGAEFQEQVDSQILSHLFHEEQGSINLNLNSFFSQKFGRILDFKFYTI